MRAGSVRAEGPEPGMAGQHGMASSCSAPANPRDAMRAGFVRAEGPEPGMAGQHGRATGGPELRGPRWRRPIHDHVAAIPCLR